jgi:ubiquinone/menaquinone biosynthesis C-methylase UbiE
MFRRFLDANRRVSHRLEGHLPQAREDLYDTYEVTVARFMNARPNQLVVDVGGGKTCPFAKYRRPELGTRIVAVDVSEEEIRANRDVDEMRVGDVMQNLPFADSEADMIVSRSVVEHLASLDAFLATSARVLKPGGAFVHLFPGRFAPFTMINRALPNWLSRRVLFFFHPTAVGIGGFPAYYDRCYYTAVERSLNAHGFELDECRISYYQSRYLNFFFPAYVVSAAYELIVRAIGWRNLGAYLLIVARKRHE